MDGYKSLEAYLTELPTSADVRRRIAENLRERNLLRQVLRLTEKKERLDEIREPRRRATR